MVVDLEFVAVELVVVGVEQLVIVVVGCDDGNGHCCYCYCCYYYICYCYNGYCDLCLDGHLERNDG